MSGELFGRKYEAIIGDRVFKNDQFHITFDVPFDDGADANVAEIEIYNLKDSTINAIKDGQKVILNAGYQSDVGAILIGLARRPSTDWSGVDKITTVNVLDGNDKWMDKFIEKTYKENITGKQILTDLIGLTGLQVGKFEIPLNMVYTSAKTIKDKLGKAITDVANDCNAAIHVNRGKIYIRADVKGYASYFILDKNHGLIGSPTPISKDVEVNKYGGKDKDGKEQYKSSKKTINGFKVKSLLNHKITTDTVIQLKSKTANGMFRVSKGKHTADGSNYYTEMEVYPV
jgi:hypothetical protein